MTRSEHNPNGVLHHPETGRPLTVAESANVAERWGEVRQAWTDIVALAVAAEATDPHQRLMALGVKIAERLVVGVPAGHPDPDGYLIGLAVGTLATAAADEATRRGPAVPGAS